MIDAKEWLELGQKFQGHKCISMVVGLRVGGAALNKLRVERAKDSELMLLVDVGENHWALDYVDGLQVITGCTLGKGNLILTYKGKLSTVLINVEKKKAVRITPKVEIVLSFRRTDFFKEYRRKGIPASKVPSNIIDPLVEFVMDLPDERLMNISDIFDYEYSETPRSFNSFVCEECNEIVIEEYGRIKGDRMVCIDCAANQNTRFNSTTKWTDNDF